MLYFPLVLIIKFKKKIIRFKITNKIVYNHSIMRKKFDKLDNKKHIMILSDLDHLPVASALYSHLLRLDKKLSFSLETKLDSRKFSFLPWYDKIRTSKIISYDFVILVDFTSVEFYQYLKDLNLKINQKMATALYGGIIHESDGFLKNIGDGTIFAVLKELIDNGADYKLCNYYLRQRTTLAYLRLKAIMLKEMSLENSATKAVFYIGISDLVSSGATIDDCCEIIKEALNLPYLKEVILLDKDKSGKIIKKIT